MTITVETRAVPALSASACSAEGDVSAVSISAGDMRVNSEISGRVINSRKRKIRAAVRTVVPTRAAVLRFVWRFMNTYADIGLKP